MSRRTRTSLHLAAAGFLALLPLFPPPVSADETAVVADQTWTYTLDDAGNATLTSGPKSGALSIPASLGSHPVTAIGGGAFSWCTNIVSVALPDTITNIATEAFIGCNGLSTVALPDSVETLGYRSFAYCYGLVSFFAGTGLRHIGEDAFQDCTALEECILSEGIETIDKMAFSYCSALPSLDLPASVANIASDAFNGSTSLARFGVAPGNPAFAECDGVLFSGDMQSLLHFPPAKTGPYTIPNGVKTIGELAFMDCQGIDWGPFPDSLETIEDFAFIYGNASSSIILPDGLRSIGRRAFYFSEISPNSLSEAPPQTSPPGPSSAPPNSSDSTSRPTIRAIPPLTASSIPKIQKPLSAAPPVEPKPSKSLPVSRQSPPARSTIAKN